MRSKVLILIIATVLFLLFFSTPGFAQRGYGMHRGIGPGPDYGYEGDWDYCPYCGRGFQGRGPYGRGSGWGRGHMGPGYGRGSGWGRGYGMRPGMMGPGYYGHYGKEREELKEEDAKEIVENFLEDTGNPNLKLGKIKDLGKAFEAEIVTKDNSLVDKLLINKYTGWMRPVR
jgi:hypothetical protein